VRRYALDPTWRADSAPPDFLAGKRKGKGKGGKGKGEGERKEKQVKGKRRGGKKKGTKGREGGERKRERKERNFCAVVIFT